MEEQTVLTSGINSEFHRTVGKVGRQPGHWPHQFQSRQQLEPHCWPRPVVELCTVKLAEATAAAEATSSPGVRGPST